MHISDFQVQCQMFMSLFLGLFLSHNFKYRLNYFIILDKPLIYIFHHWMCHNCDPKPQENKLEDKGIQWPADISSGVGIHILLHYWHRWLSSFRIDSFFSMNRLSHTWIAYIASSYILLGVCSIRCFRIYCPYFPILSISTALWSR